MITKEIEITKEMLLYILDQIHEAVHIVDHRGIIIYANNGAESLERIPKEKMVGKDITSIYTHTDYEKGSLPPCLIVLKTGIPRINENSEYYSSDGNSVNSIVSNYPYYIDGEDNEVAAVLGISENINQMKERLIKLGGIESKHTYRLRKKLMKNGTVYIFDDIIGESPSMKSAVEMAKRFAAKKMPIMLYGETGTGKEMFAQSIHNASPAMHNNFVPINCAAIPENLLESILFGTVKGAFTGALDKEGLFEKAHGGTVFLDEINSMPIGLQAKILRVLQEKEVQRIGDSKTKKIDCRIISATNKQPIEAIRCGELREDLFYRLSTGIVFIPPLRERSGDLGLLARYFMETCNEDFGNSIYQISDDFQNMLSQYSWPGNIRELANTIESSMNMTAPGEIILSLKHLPAYLRNRFQQEIHPETLGDFSKPKDADLPTFSQPNTGLKNMVGFYEKALIEKTLSKERGNVSRCSVALDITRQGLEKKIKKYGIDVNKYRKNSTHE
ncbi:MAG: sigma 54-interacting transcriptional regulator [Clostridiales bacterium]